MILLWDSSDMKVTLTFVEGETRDSVQWQADRTLARNMLDFLRSQLQARDLDFSNIDGIGVFRGPGSFTGLRIGLTVLNTLAHAERIPIVGADDEQWQDTCLARLRAEENDEIVLPEYGAPAHTTKPRK